MFSSKSELLAQKSVQDAARANSELCDVATEFDAIHMEVENHPNFPNVPMSEKRRKIKSRKKLVSLLDAGGIRYNV